MRKFILLCLFINFYILAYNQVIKGTILDQKTHNKISFAYVYFNGTFVGTNSDKNGNFELDISKYSSMPLTISALGYYSVTMNIYSFKKPVIINMKPKVFELNEVVVSGKAHYRERRENLKLFEDTFLGVTRNANDCEITNENDIIFKTDNDTLKAFSVNPILIDNKALGYKVSYFLDEFNYNKKDKSFFFSGNIIFTEDLTTDKTKNLIFESRRKHAYLGSRMHFFRSLWENELDSSKFIVKNPALENLTYSNIVNEEDSLTKYLQYPEDLGICYHTSLPSTYVIFLESEVYFDKNGYFDPSGISWQGEMARRRIADWLPYEYSFK
jgi:hypothetical protein